LRLGGALNIGRSCCDVIIAFRLFGHLRQYAFLIVESQGVTRAFWRETVFDTFLTLFFTKCYNRKMAKTGFNP
ncbi:MAG: hypothetical protein PHI93_12495, partial [Kiritimatiellae bacterium]|nr:hypothetical protein [Kiritimatiellia bacterium]